MAIIPSTTTFAPSPNEANAGVPVHSAVMMLIADQTNHLAFAKAKRHQIGFVNRTYPRTWTQNQADYTTESYYVDQISIGDTNRAYTQILQTTANCRHIVFAFAYRTHENLARSISITAFRNPRTTQDIIDNGCLLSVANGQLSSTYDPDGSSNFWNQALISSGGDISSTSIVQTLYPRPLFIPEAYRGQEIGVKFDCVRVRLDNVCLYEAFDEVIND